MDTDLQYRVDQLLMEQGEYIPLEYLLAEGRLDYQDYQRWREGDLTWLDRQLFGDPAQILSTLEQAVGYCKALGLESDQLSYLPWGGGKSLGFSQNRRLDQLFHQCCRKAADQPQMDLFMDSAGNHLANAIVLALLRHDQQAAEAWLDKLYRNDPGHPRLGGLERLVEAAANLPSEVDDTEQALAYLEDRILPLAEDLLGSDSRHFLIPQWQRLGRALSGRGFDSEVPGLHASYAAERALDWSRVKGSIAAESDWRAQPVLLVRHARACEQLKQPAQALPDWFDLCWRFPDQASRMGGAGPDIARAWRLFTDLEPPLDNRCFPAWLLILRPALTGLLPEPDIGPEDYRLLYSLQQGTSNSRESPSRQLLQWRAELKRLNPELFHHFIANLSS